jgi:hypothetical protein
MPILSLVTSRVGYESTSLGAALMLGVSSLFALAGNKERVAVSSIQQNQGSTIHCLLS